MLETVMKWHAEREAFERECSGYPGFITKYRVTEKSSQGTDTDNVDFENYRHVCHKWHYKIAKALVVCLESKDFVQIRNSLIVLTKIKEQFPVIQKLSTVIEKRIEKVCEEEKEKRKDLYIKARSYQGQLQAKKSKMMKEAEFHQVKGKVKGEGKDRASSPAARPSPAKREESREEGEIKEKEAKSQKRIKIEETERERSKSKDPKDKNERTSRDSSSRDKDERHKSSSRERSEDREKKGDMGPPQEVTREGSRHRSQDPDSDKDYKRRRNEI